jgi:hypothetical protein
MHTGVIRNIGVVVATRAGVENQAPLHWRSEMFQMLVRMDVLQSTMASLAGRASVVEVVAQRHTDMAASIDG